MTDADCEPVSRLGLLPTARDAPPTPGQPERATYLTRLRDPLEQLEFTIDARRLTDLLQQLDIPETDPFGLDGTFEFLSVADTAWPEDAASSLRQVAGVQDRDDSRWPLEPGRLPLYVCPMCGDLLCGALTVAVDWWDDNVVWRDFRREDGWTDRRERIDLRGLGPFVFKAEAYRATLLRAVAALEVLAEHDAVAEAQSQKPHRGRRFVTRLLGR